MLRIAERTLQVTTGEAYKDRRSARMKALSLQAIKYLVDLSHKQPRQSPHRQLYSIRTPALLP